MFKPTSDSRPGPSEIVYFDNGATSWPKPPSLSESILHYMNNIGASPGRSGHHRAIQANRIVMQARENLAVLFNVADPSRIIFTKNATEGLNQAIFGLLQPGDRVVTSSLEHNSVMRPLRKLEAAGEIEICLVPALQDSSLDLDALRRILETPTKLVVITHGSNVSGLIHPIDEIGKLARENGTLFLVDAAQTAGCIPIDVEAASIDLLAFTGHKSLFGPTGTGGLYIRPGIDLSPLTLGGTGSLSEEERQPTFLPDALESGTLNAVGLAGLEASTRFLLDEGVEKIRQHEMALAKHLIDGMAKIEGLRQYGPLNAENRLSLVSFNLENLSPSEVGLALDEEYGVLSRVGLHCAPAAHKTLGTFPDGTVRFSLGYFNNNDQIDFALNALSQIVRGDYEV